MSLQKLKELVYETLPYPHPDNFL
uniref:SUF system NifU family Fe-S cluster assembly protein n=1 Tax=Heterorhabditis bacteriophora TaxID=37862 RepID=A0A1I7X8L1_HETBA